MKKIFLSLGVAATLGMASCSEDFEVAAPYQDVTVVYGVWDREDSAHYVRIQKAFLDEDKSAVDMAKVADSSYYKDLTVVVKELKGGSVLSTTQLSKVNLAAEGYIKNPPANEQGFFTSPHNGYKFTRTLDPANTYRLVITNNATGNVDSSEIAIVGTPGSNSFPSANWEIQFARISGKYSLNITPTPNARFYEVTMRINYVDVDVNSNTETNRFVDVPFERVFPTPIGGNGRLEILHSEIYRTIATQIPAAPANIRRRLTTCTFLLYAGSNEIYQYEQLANGQGGITNDQIRPNFTNIKGKNTLGLLASKAHTMTLDYPLGNVTIDSLIKHPLTTGLNIYR